MLILTRNQNETIVIDDDIRILSRALRPFVAGVPVKDGQSKEKRESVCPGGMQTELQMMDIAALSGFTRAEQFSRAYLIRFDITPTRDRIEGRIPFQLRNFTDRAGYHSVD